MSVIGKGILSAVVLCGATVFNGMYNAAAPLVAGKLAVEQLNDSDVGYAAGVAASHINGAPIATGGVVLLLLVLIWGPGVYKAIKNTITE